MATPERSADLAMIAIDAATDRNYASDPDRKAGLATDLSDLLVNVRHLCDRSGFEYADIDDHGYMAYCGDKETEPTAEWREDVPVSAPGNRHMVALSTEAYAVLCGLVQPTDEVNAAGINSLAWDELRRTFPLAHFEMWATANPDDGERDSFYNPDAGE